MNTWPKGKPYGKKKAIYIAKMYNMKVLESVIVKDRVYYIVKQVWVHHVEFNTNYKFIVEPLGKRIHRITRIR